MLLVIDAMAYRKGSKFRNKITYVDNIRFDSKLEAARYQELKLLERAGKIKDLRLQVGFPLEVNNSYICKYVADFVYYDLENKKNVVEDTKGMLTPVFRLKKKLMKAIHGIDITLTYA